MCCRCSKRGGVSGKKYARARWLAVLPLLLILAALSSGGRLTVSGSSMEPFLLDGDVLYYSRIDTPEYGDVVVVISEDADNKLIVKRLLGLPGDRIETYADGRLSRNGALLKEEYAYLDAQGLCAEETMTVDDGYYFVLGDNRAVSVDSRDARVGPIEKGRICGVVVYIRRTLP